MYMLSWRWCSLVVVATFSRIKHPATKEKWLRDGLGSTNEFEVLAWSPNSPDVNPVEHLWDLLAKQFRSMEAAPHNLQDLKGPVAKMMVQILHHHLFYMIHVAVDISKYAPTLC